MDYDNKKVAGLLFIVAVVQYVLAIVVSEAVYPGYSVGQQMVSELGDWSLAGNNAAILNASIILYGLLVIAGAYYVQRIVKNRLFAPLLAINGIGSIVCGFVSLNISFEVHGTFGLIAFISIVAAAIVSYKLVKSPLSYISVILGTITLLGIVLFMAGQGDSVFYLGLGLGGIERVIIYPMALWLLGVGAYLIGDSSDKK
jgi:hypothetical membrane protein